LIRTTRQVDLVICPSVCPFLRKLCRNG